MNLTTEGFTINDEDGNIKWSTPRLNSKVSAFELSERGLFLLDRLNQTLWESFQSPTDVVVIGQPLPAGTTLNGMYQIMIYQLLITDSESLAMM